MRYSKTASVAKSEASHMISNGFNQSGVEMIGVEMSFFLSFSQAIRHPSSKVKDMFLANKLVKGLVVLLKSSINL